MHYSSIQYNKQLNLDIQKLKTPASIKGSLLSIKNNSFFTFLFPVYNAFTTAMRVPPVYAGNTTITIPQAIALVILACLSKNTIVLVQPNITKVMK